MSDGTPEVDRPAAVCYLYGAIRDVTGSNLAAASPKVAVVGLPV